MIKRTQELPVIFTSFAFQKEHFPEMEKTVESVRKHHPDCLVVTGKGPLLEMDPPILEVQSPSGDRRWGLPVSLNLDGGCDDRRKITLMKAWWIARVWHSFGYLVGNSRRILWLDACSQMSGPLDIELHTEAEILAAVWPRNARHLVMDGDLLLFQGVHEGTIETILNRWSDACLSRIQKRQAPSPDGPGECDQAILTQILKFRPPSNQHYILIRLEPGRYCVPLSKEPAFSPETLAGRSMAAGSKTWHGEES